ncbi:MAG: MBL fold metallo-hydrolase [Chloroflexi bacterium]|nr:MBL fold metallo-hydrolase [Chloroflexota bacterium]
MSVYQLKIGDIECAVLQEGAAFMDRDSVIARYPNAEPAEVEAALGEGEPSGSLNLLVVKSGSARILADVGFGEAGPPGMGGTLRGLESLGLSPADIDIVYLTHFHGDHIAGFFNPDGSAVYANALYVTTQAEWDEWMGRWAASDAEADKQNLARFNALRDRFSFVGDGDEVAPGVTVVSLEGHTLGHSGLLVESGGDRLLHVVDLLHQPFQFEHIDWHFGFDSDGALAAETRKRTLQHCVDEAVLTLFYHMDFPGLGRVEKDGEFFVWKPIS